MSSQAEQLQQTVSFFRVDGSLASPRAVNRSPVRSRPMSGGHRVMVAAPDDSNFVKF